MMLRSEAMIQNIGVEWVPLLLYIQVPGSDLSPQTGNTHWSFSQFSSVPQENSGHTSN
jgi:hypothetical protein